MINSLYSKKYLYGTGNAYIERPESTIVIAYFNQSPDMVKLTYSSTVSLNYFIKRLHILPLPSTNETNI